MKLPRRQFLHLAAGAAALPAVLRIARAEAYPAQPVRIIVGFPVGGGTDITARLIGQWLSERLGRQFSRGKGGCILKVAKSLGIGTGTVQRISKERVMSPRGAEQ